MADFSKFTQVAAVVSAEKNAKTIDIWDVAQLQDTDIHYTWEGR